MKGDAKTLRVGGDGRGSDEGALGSGGDDGVDDGGGSDEGAVRSGGDVDVEEVDDECRGMRYVIGKVVEEEDV